MTAVIIIVCLIITVVVCNKIFSSSEYFGGGGASYRENTANTEIQTNGVYMLIWDFGSKPFCTLYFGAGLSTVSCIFHAGFVGPLFSGNYSNLALSIFNEHQKPNFKGKNLQIVNNKFQFDLPNAVGGISKFSGKIINNASVSITRKDFYGDGSLKATTPNETYQYHSFNDIRKWKRSFKS